MSDSIFPRPGQTALFVVDIQERLLPAMPEAAVALMLRQTHILIELAREFGWPVYYSEQYPKGLGPTEASLLQKLQEANATRIEKVEFSAARNEVFAQTVLPRLPSHVIVVGMETHICVLQTVSDLQARGHQIFIPNDAVASRLESNRQNGIQLMRQAGAVETNTESLMFYYLQKAGTDAFKRFQKMIL